MIGSVINSWVEQFSDNFQWSNAMLVCKGMAPFGCVSMNDLTRISIELRKVEVTSENWKDIWYNEANINFKKAKLAEKEKKFQTSGLYYLRAGNYFYTGERFIPPGEEKLELSKKAFNCYHSGLKKKYPEIEFIELPYEDTSLPGLFYPAKNNSKPAPTIIIFNGMDNCKEMSILFAGLEFSNRGYNVLAIDGPGQGESLRLRGINARYDYEVVGTLAYDWARDRSDVDERKIAIIGYSFGGYYASRIAAFEKRFAAGISLTAGHWDLHEFQRETLAKAIKNGKSIAQSNFQFQWVVGSKTSEDALEKSKKFSTKVIANKIKIPFLVTHGENDKIIPVINAKKLYDAIPESTIKKLKIFSAIDGGCEHAHVDDRQVGINYAADWLTSIFNSMD